MNNLGPRKQKWLEDQGCYFEQDGADLICDSTQIYINTDNGKVYVGLADLGEKDDTVNFIYKHRLTNLDTLPGCKTCCIGFNKDEQAWYGWTHRGYGKFSVGYKVKKGSLLDCGKYTYPFTCRTLDDCKSLAMAMAEALN